MKLFIGLDVSAVSLAKTAVCVVNEHGKIVKETEIAGEPEALSAFAGTLPGTVAIIGMEAGPLSQWLHRGLTEAGLDVVLMEIRQVKGALKAMPKGLPACFISAGSGRCIANPCQHKRFARFWVPVKRSSKVRSLWRCHCAGCCRISGLR